MREGFPAEEMVSLHEHAEHLCVEQAQVHVCRAPACEGALRRCYDKVMHQKVFKVSVTDGSLEKWIKYFLKDYL